MLTFFSQTPQIPFLAYRRPGVLVGCGLVLIALLALFVGRGLNLGIDFQGGTLMEVRVKPDISLPTIRDLLAQANVGQGEVQTFGAPDVFLIRFTNDSLSSETPGPGDPEGGTAQASVATQNAAIARLKSHLEPFVLEFRRTEFVGPVVGAELRETAFWAIMAALGAILVYIWFRFEWQFGLGAILAIFHDVVTTLGFFAITGLEFTLASVAALLTIAGYSVNDTVVIYDRIRENMQKYKKRRFIEIANLSLNETLSRTIVTSATTFLALLALVLFGGPILRGFALAMLWGIVIGTWSSLGLAVPLLVAIEPQPPDETSESGSGPGEDENAIPAQFR